MYAGGALDFFDAIFVRAHGFAALAPVTAESSGFNAT